MANSYAGLGNGAKTT